MAKQKLTPEFPPEVKPVHVGVYQRLFDTGTRYALWDGEEWCFAAGTPEVALSYATYQTTYRSLPWRGLAEQPKGSAKC